MTRVLFTEPSNFSKTITNSIPNTWRCFYEEFEDSRALILWLQDHEVDIVFARLGLAFDAKFFCAASNLSVLATPTTGLDHIDLDHAKINSVKVIALRGETDFLRTISSTAEHAWALLLACNRKLPQLIGRTKEGAWSRVGLDLHQLSGSTLGIIGLGRLGEMLARYGNAFGMNVAGFDTTAGECKFDNVRRHSSLEALLQESDHIIMSASYTYGDPVIIADRQVDHMKTGSTLVNISRGELLDEDAIIRGLDVGIIGAVGLDVLQGDSRWDSKKPVKSSLISRSKNDDRVILTPHVGGYAVEAIAATRTFLLQRVIEYMEDVGMKNEDNS